MKAAFGWLLICRHAASHGIVSVVLNGSDMRREEVSWAEEAEAGAEDAAADVPRSELDRPHAPGLPQQPPLPPVAAEQPPPPLSERHGQSLQGDVDATDWLMAAQNALPKASSAHAAQFAGSPVQDGTSGCAGSGVGMVIGNIGCKEGLGARRRRGTGGWYAGRLSRMDGWLMATGGDIGSAVCSVVSSFMEETVMRSATC